MALPADYEGTFQAIDADGDGRISSSELQALMARLGEPMDGGTAAGVIQMMDGDGDGLVTRDEMETFLSAR